MLVVYTKYCLASSKKNNFKVQLSELEKRSMAWDSAERDPDELFLVVSDLEEFTGYVMELAQRDEFGAYYMDKNDKIALSIIY